MTLTAALIMLTPPALAEPEVWLQEESSAWSRDTVYFHMNCAAAHDPSGIYGWTAPGSADMAMWIDVEARNIGARGARAELPCEERFGAGALCDDELIRVLDIRMTAEAAHPVTFHDVIPHDHNAGSGRNAITLTLYGAGTDRYGRVKIERDCGVGEDDMPVLIRAAIIAERVEANPYGPDDFD